MNNKQKHRGFSLIEVLMAVGILAVGMIFIAGVFPAGIYLTSVATERTIAAVAADEAFAKIKIYAVGDPNKNDDIDLAKLKKDELTDFNNTAVFPATADINSNEFAYPSTNTVAEKQYCWSALCRRAGTDPNDRLVQITVFVSRKAGTGLRYPKDNFDVPQYDWPTPVKVNVDDIAGHKNELKIRDSDKTTFINDDYTIVDNETGRIYRVLERYRDAPDTILLDRDWQGGSSGSVWVVPPPVNGGRYPCIAVYQKVIRF